MTPPALNFTPAQVLLIFNAALLLALIFDEVRRPSHTQPTRTRRSRSSARTKLYSN